MLLDHYGDPVDLLQVRWPKPVPSTQDDYLSDMDNQWGTHDFALQYYIPMFVTSMYMYDV